MKITFNTDRPYTKDGQIIHAEYVASEQRVYFHDESRMIAGSFHWLYGSPDMRYLRECTVMAYDHSIYRNERIPPAGQARREPEPVVELTSDEYVHAAVYMETGERGHFAEAIGRAHAYADRENLRRLHEAFPELFRAAHRDLQEQR